MTSLVFPWDYQYYSPGTISLLIITTFCSVLFSFLQFYEVSTIVGCHAVNPAPIIHPSLELQEAGATSPPLSPGHYPTPWWRCLTEKIVEVHRYFYIWYSPGNDSDWSIWCSFQCDKKKKSFFQRHLPSAGDNERDSKTNSPLSSPQVVITRASWWHCWLCSRTAARWGWWSPQPDRHTGGRMWTRCLFLKMLIIVIKQLISYQIKHCRYTLFSSLESIFFSSAWKWFWYFKSNSQKINSTWYKV